MSFFDIENSKGLTRKLFLGRVGKVAAVLTAGIAGLVRAESAQARTVACCTLAYDNDCPGNPPTCNGCQTHWSWTCFYQPTGRFYTCGECYANGCAGCSYALLNAGAGPAP